jgi:uncharacterized protein (DUF58 family)
VPNEFLHRPVILVSVRSNEARAYVVDELNRRYAADYRILDAATHAALGSLLRSASARGDRVALLLADGAAGGAGVGAGRGAEPVDAIFA